MTTSETKLSFQLSRLLRLLSLRNCDTGAARTAPCLHRHNLIIEVAVGEPMLRPKVEMVGGSHCSRCALALSNGEVLRESASSRDRWLVDPSISADLVCASIRGHSAEVCGPAAGVVSSIALNDVVFGLG